MKKGSIKYKSTALLAVMCLLVIMFSSIGCTDSNKSSYLIYYTNSSSTKLVTKSYKTSTTSGYVLINELLKQMNTKQKDNDYVVLKPDKVSIESINYEDGIANINFSKEYNELGSSNELLYRAAIVKMLSQIDGLKYVKFYVDGNDAQHSDGTNIGLMSPDDFVDDSNEQIKDVKWVNLDLYYANKYGDKLSKTQVTVAQNKSVSLEKMVVEKLIGGPMNTSLAATLPSDVKLLSISVKNNVCYVNLNSVFLSEMVNVPKEIPIYSIVNSLCELDSIDSVRIMVNGDSNVTYRDSISLDSTFEYNKDIVE